MAYNFPVFGIPTALTGFGLGLLLLASFFNVKQTRMLFLLLIAFLTIFPVFTALYWSQHCVANPVWAQYAATALGHGNQLYLRVPRS